MAEIKDIYNDAERTEQIYPRTHEKAVVDNNGTTAETKFQMITDLVNQKQMEVGAVPSDLTPTAGSTNWVASGGVYNALNFEENVDLSQYATKTCSMGSPNWYASGEKGKHKAIPVTVGDKFHLTSQTVGQTYGAYYGWLTSSYNGSATSGTAVPYVSGTSRTSIMDAYITAPEGAAYLCLTIVDGAGDSIINTLATIKSLKSKVEELSDADSEPTNNSGKYVTSDGIYDALAKKVNTYDVLQSYKLSNLTEKNCSLGTSTWYMSGSNGRHKYIEVTAGHYYLVNGSAFIGWLTSSYDTTTDPTNGSTIPYVSGTGRVFSSSGVYIAPTNASYLIICTVDGGGGRGNISQVDDIDPNNSMVYRVNNIDTRVGTLEYDMANTVGGLNDQWSVVDLQSYPLVYGILNGSSAQWYKAEGFYHIAIPVTAGEKYIVKRNGYFYYGLLQSYSGTSTPPVYSAYSTSRQDMSAGTYEITIPSDCTYIVFSAKSGGTNVLPQLMCKLKILPWVLDQMINGGGVTQVKFRYAHWNVGHFSYYDKTLGASDTTISGEDSPVMALRYRKMMNKISPDILGIAEDNPTFDLAGGLAKNLVWQNWKYQFQGTKNGYRCNSVYSNFKGVDGSEVSYTTHTQNTNFHTTMINIGGVQTVVVETHLDWANNQMYDQMTQLINALASYTHVIIGGDFNVTHTSNYQQFLNAGYTIVSGGYAGDLPTYLRYLEDSDPDNNDSLYLDNIIVKGFAASNAKAWDESGWSEGGLSDHSCISCDLVLLP